MLIPAILVFAHSLSPAALEASALDYFPTIEGTVVVTEEESNGKKERVVARILAPVVAEGATISPRFVQRGDGTTRGRFVSVSPTLIAMAAVSRPADAAPQVLKSAIPLLVGPIAVGTTFEMAYVLQSLDQPMVSLKMRIESISETMETRAGKFTNCVRVEGRASATKASARVDVVDTTFFCPRVGIVRGTTTETVRDGDKVVSLVDRVELVEFQSAPKAPAPSTATAPPTTPPRQP